MVPSLRWHIGSRPDPLEQDLINTPCRRVAGGERGFCSAPTARAGYPLALDLWGACRAHCCCRGRVLAASGSVLGLLAGYFGEWVDTLISSGRHLDELPAVLLSIVLAALPTPACIPS
jgi:hypothetical protein